MEKHFFFIRLLNKLSEYTSKVSFLSEVSTYINNLKHKKILKRIEPYLYYSFYNVSNDIIKNCKFNNVVWFFWLQGSHNMPLIVRRCYNSLLKNSNNYHVIFIDKNNVRKYARLPEYIYYKVRHNIITFTEFSDILRCNLLKNYGGIWSDSTNFWTSNINYKYFYKNKLLITSGCYKKYRQYISTKWTVSLMGGYKNNPLFIFMNKFFVLYWKDNNYLISYNLIDYALYFAYQHNIGQFKYYVDKKTPFNNPKMFELIKYLNKNFNSYIYEKLTSNTHVFKLTYKSHFNNDKNTFYHRLINNEL